MQNFFFDEDIVTKEVDDKTKRKVLAHGKELMICHLYFKTGAIGGLHKHSNTQCAYVLKGKFEFILKDETKIIKEGDSVFIPSNEKHGLNCLEEGEILDIFTPEREDFLNE